MTRKSTAKYEILAQKAGIVALSGISKTDATKIARRMGKGMIVRPVDPFARIRASEEIEALGTTPEKYGFRKPE